MEQMYSTTRAENAQISNQVQRLSAQVQSLSEQLHRLAR
ncbi:MbeD/MobD family mobilization/exclusion protein [Pleomorphomonas sp. T1.2MG-36]